MFKTIRNYLICFAAGLVSGLMIKSITIITWILTGAVLILGGLYCYRKIKDLRKGG